MSGRKLVSHRVARPMPMLPGRKATNFGLAGCFRRRGIVAPTRKIVDDQTLEFLTGRIPAAEELEVRVYFPHGMVIGVPPAWQIKLEQREAYNAEVKPIINLLLMLFGLV